MTAVQDYSERHNYDVAIIGGGVVGMSIAYGLLGRGLSILVLDEGDNAFRASRGNFALVWVTGKGVGMPEYARWSAHSADIWADFASDLTRDAETSLFYSRRGGVTPCLSDEELEDRVKNLTRLHNQAPDLPAFEILDHAQIRELVPALGPEVVGGTYSKADGQTNALRLLSALHKASIERGVSYQPNEQVTALGFKSGGFHIRTQTREFYSGKVVLAAGLGNRQLAPMVGMSAPVVPERGEALITEKLEQFLDFPVGEIRQTNEGGVLIGVSQEDVGFNKSTDSRVLTGIARRAVRMMPRLADVQIVRSWGALRVMSPDGFPIYEKSQTNPGAYLVTCHSGITLAAAHCKIIAKAIAEDCWPEVLRTFSAQRFGDVSTPV